MQVDIRIIETSDQFNRAMDELESQQSVAVDTETVGTLHLWERLEVAEAEVFFEQRDVDHAVTKLAQKGHTKEEKAALRLYRDEAKAKVRELTAEVRKLKSEIKKSKDALDPYRNILGCVQVGTDYAVNGGVGTCYMMRPEVVEPVRFQQFIDSRQEVILQNAKFDYKQLKHHKGILLRSHNLIDTRAREYIITCGTNALIGADTLFKKYCGVIKDKKVALSNWCGEWKPEMLHYAANDVCLLFDVVRGQDNQLEPSMMDTVYLEQDLSLVLGDMELAGIRVDKELAAEAAESAHRELVAAEATVRELLPGVENPYSNPQLLAALQAKGFELTSVDKKALNSLKGSAPDLLEALIKMRGLAKAISTYYEPLRDLAILHNEGKDDEHWRIHTNFNALGKSGDDDEAGTDTGRLSSSAPNLQNQSNKASFTTSDGRVVPLRSIFVSRPGWTFIHVDLPQIEPRILAHICQDPTLKKAFELSKDVYLMMGSMMSGREYEDVETEYKGGSKVLRDSMKVALLSVMYLKTAFGLARDYAMTQAEAHRFLNGFFRKFLPIKRFIKITISNAKKQGYVETIGGRRRYLPDINSDKQWLVSSCERKAVNTRIQGTAADGMKASLVMIRNGLKAAGLDAVATLLITVHDEVVVECLDVPEVINRVKAIVKAGMERGTGQYIPSIPVEVEPSVLTDWSQGKG